MSRFDRVAILDWSAASKPTPRRPSDNAIWLAEVRGTGPAAVRYLRTRADAVEALAALADAALAAGERLLIGADFPFGYPAGFAAALTGRGEALAVWDWLAAHLQDGPDNANNRFALAEAINARFPGTGPFWGRPATLAAPGLPEKGNARHGHGLPERRQVELLIRSVQPCWKLYTTGSVGSQALTGIPALNRLRRRYGPRLAVWPFAAPDAPVVLAEVYPSLLDAEVRAAMAAEHRAIKDAVQVRLLAGALASLSAQNALAPLLAPAADPAVLAEEGWILGAGHAALLRAVLRSG